MLYTELIFQSVAFMSIVLTEFARNKLFPKQRQSSSIQGCSASEFIDYITTTPTQATLPGYAPFCRLLVYPNWTDTRCSYIRITDDNKHLLRSAYQARQAHELPVLVRWFEDISASKAMYLLPILYHRTQLEKEGSPISEEWGVVGCLYTAEPEEIPMSPITMMRNALGVEEGGSGVALDRDRYQRSVDFWQRHAAWRSAK